MLKGMAFLGVGLMVSAFGCGSSNSGGSGGPDIGGHGGFFGPGTGGGGVAGPTGAGGGAGSIGPSPTGTAGSGPIGGAGGAAGTTAGGGAGGASAGGTGGGVACTGDPLTRCAGTMVGAWCTETLAAGALPSFEGLWANRPDDVWFVGGQFPPGGATTAFGMIGHFDGCAWTISQRPDLPALQGVWGAASNDVWIVAASGTAFHWDGSALTPVPVPGATGLSSVSGTSSTDVWAVGNAIFHWNGSAWAQSSPSVGDDVWAVAPNDVWVASGSTDALHFDGTAWTPTTLTDFGLFSIWADGTQAYAAGEGEALFRFAGGTWTTLQVRGGSSQGFIDIGGLGSDIFTVGNNKVVKLAGNTFTTITDPPPASYRSVWVSPTQIWFGARNGVISHRAR